MWLALANASIRIAADLETVVFGAPLPFLKLCAVYGPWIWRSMFHWKKPPLVVSVDSRQTLNVKPEQSPPSPPVFGSSVGSPGESSWSLSFQQPPAHWYPSYRARSATVAEPSRVRYIGLKVRG